MSQPTVSSGVTGSSAAHSESAGAVRVHRGPGTVINPERRPAPSAPQAAEASAKSAITRALFPPEDDPAGETTAERGVQLGHFTIIERIRSGGMGAVFRASDTRLSRIVALKVLPPALSRDPLIVQRFQNEAQAAAQLDHENIARVFYIGEDQGLHFIAFEFIAGTNVRELIQKQGRLPVGDAVNYALQIASALVHTSAQGVVHRDIKPSNIIITPSGRAKLVDLGLARRENRDDEAADLTIAGTTLGTYDYIPPEQARDPRTADVRSDIYSLGCTLYHMLTGEPPYPEGTMLQKLLQHQGDEAPDPSEKNNAVPENLSVVVRRMMAKDLRRRYQTAEQLVHEMLIVAGSMGLRSASPEGLVWMSAGQPRTSFWERHLSWMGTAAALLLIVGYLEYGGSSGSSTAARSTGAPGEVVAAAPGKAPSEIREASAPLRKAGAGPHSSPGPEAAGLKDNDPKSGGPDSVGAETGSAFDPIPLAQRERPGSDGGYSVGPPLLSPTGVRPGKTELANKRTPSAARVATDAGASPRATAEPSTDRGDVAVNSTAQERDTEESNLNSESPPMEEDGIYLLGREGQPARRFATLEAACSAARERENGAIIELRFDGKRTESTLKIRSKLTIRAAKGRRPVIEFRPVPVITDGYQLRAISISSGSLDLMGVELALFVDETVSAEQWSLFSVERPEMLHFQKVTATIVNPRSHQAALVEFRRPAGEMMPDMPMVGGQSRPPLDITAVGSLFRGQCDLFLVRHGEPLRLTMRQSIVAVEGRLLSVRGLAEGSQENPPLEVRLEHVTAGLGGGMIRIDGGSAPSRVLPVHVFAYNSIFSNVRGAPATPLVSMTGDSPSQAFRTLVQWAGKNNIYDRFVTFSSFESMDGGGRSETLDFAAWRQNPAEDNASAVEASIWRRRAWIDKPFAELTPLDFALRVTPDNPAVAGATDSTDVGAAAGDSPTP